MPDIPDTRKLVAEHLKFFGELGAIGFRRDPAWALRAGTVPDAIESEEGRGQPPAPGQRRPAETQSAKAGGKREEGREKAEPEARSPEPGVLDLASIREDIGDCTRCKLCGLGRKQIVFGVGNPHADLMFVGEAPGRDEDIQGIPFVGRAGQKLTQIIEAIGLTREDVYIANVIKCRPPENRNPEPDEVEKCEPFLFRQIDSIKPRVIVALGTFAARSLLKTDAPISRLRGRVYEYRGARLIPTFHPAYLLRNPSCRREVWEDMKKVRELLNDRPSSIGDRPSSNTALRDAESTIDD
jgi:uracil-DNA glycosylase family 4